MNEMTAKKDSKFQIRTNADDLNAIKSLAKFHGQTLSSFVMNTLYEKLEEWEDMRAIDEYEKEPNHKTYSAEEIKERLGL